MTADTRFREYVTSGTFRMSLSRAQISALSMVAETGDSAMGEHTFRALHAKGLIEMIRRAPSGSRKNDQGGLEYRLTEAGAVALQMVRLAQLDNGRTDAVTAELRALREQLGDVRALASQLLSDHWDMHARVEETKREAAALRCELDGEPAPSRPMVRLKDRHPERTIAEMSRDAARLEAKLK
ncbi:hypothetical protein [Salipiger mucosus]|uniref:Uncharacterized protein n=1 Tax=Salipiger mucosus DSM 16094 TaxID=1123237 RepID=S9QGE5_9RHOB|nr:hypothetical protein [Salipiger mucosus]EPX80496.1 hypothetical protein Salmuc_03813 [Salipiger mucosus DSM 16094]